MSTKWMRLLLTMMALLAIGVFAACGDDDDDDSGGPSGPGGDSANEDNDDDGDNEDDEGDEDEDDDNDSPSGPGGGDDEEYIAHICTAMNDFVSDVIEAGSDPDNQDASEEEQLELFREPFANLVNALEDADPPGDIDEYHDDLVEAFREVQERIEDGDVTAFESDPFEELPEPPADVQEKYSALAEEVPECASTGLFGDE